VKGELRGLVLTAILVGAALVGLHLLLRSQPTQPGWEFFPDMGRSLAAESFDADALLPGGTVLQPPLPGVVVRGTEAFDYGVGEAEQTRAGLELKSPIAADDALALARGQQVYRTFCIVCHDARGDGQGSVVARGMIRPPSLSGARAMALPDGALFHLITRGQGNMASFAAQIPPSDRWSVIAYVRKLQSGGAK